MASHSLEVADCVADGIHSHVTHVQSARWVRKHGEDVKLLPVGTLGKQILYRAVRIPCGICGKLDFNLERM